MTDAAGAPDLLDRRLVLVTGKGGVGKSSVSAALAVAAERRGKRVLLVELGARPVMGELLNGSVPTHKPTCIATERHPRLWVAHLDPRRALQEYLVESIGVRSLARLATENRVLARLWQAAPSVDEMSILTALERFEHERDGSMFRYDLIVVDMPATGHAKTMLGVPSGALAMIRVGSMADRARQVDELLRNREKTAVVIVTLPEELPINESVELAQALDDELDLDTAAVVVNAVLPRIYDENERLLISKLADILEDAAGRKLLEAATHTSARQEAQHSRIAGLHERLDTDFIEIPFDGSHGAGLVEHMAASLEAEPS
ncbi:MAG: ArsA family ATPase [Myxococcota bacterium]